MWAKLYLIQLILSYHINLYKINLYKSLWLYHYSFFLDDKGLIVNSRQILRVCGREGQNGKLAQPLPPIKCMGTVHMTKLVLLFSVLLSAVPVYRNRQIN